MPACVNQTGGASLDENSIKPRNRNCIVRFKRKPGYKLWDCVMYCMQGMPRGHRNLHVHGSSRWVCVHSSPPPARAGHHRPALKQSAVRKDVCSLHVCQFSRWIPKTHLQPVAHQQPFLFLLQSSAAQLHQIRGA